MFREPGFWIVILVTLFLFFVSYMEITDNKNRNYISYRYLYEHNVSYETIKTKEYAKYILKRKYKEAIKNIGE